MPTEIEIVSPDRLLLSKPVDMAVLPGSEGEIAAQPGTAPMIIALRGGTIRLYSGDQVTDRLYVAGGFAEITPERCTVLANEAVPVTEIDRSAAEQALQTAQSAYDSADKMDMFSVDRALDGLQAAQARLAAVTAA